MKNQYKQFFIITFLFISVLLKLYSYEKKIFTRYNVEHGLSHSSIYAIYQDSIGYLWIGTTNGLNRFDGHQFRIYKNNPNDPNSLLDNYVTAITEDDQQNLWITTLGGLCKFNLIKEEFTHYTYSNTVEQGLTDNNLWGI